MSDIQSESQHERKGSEHGGIGRRRLLRAGLAAAPVVLAVSGRSAMAAACPPGLSGPTMTSINPSGDGVNCIASSHTHTASSSRLGLSPDYWKPNPEGRTFQPPYSWPIAPFKTITTQGNKTYSFEQGQGLFDQGSRKTERESNSSEGTTYTWNPTNYLEYRGIPQNADGWDTGTKYNAIFTSSFERRSFSRILLEANGSLEWHFCAAYLNAAAMPGTYVLSIQDVLEIASTGRLVPGGSQLTDGQIKAFLSQTWS
jgi:hypothetical protein